MVSKLMLSDDRRGGSALLLTVMIIAILTTTTLASVAVRFDQLSSTDRVANSTVAKSAADGALIKVKEKLANNQPIAPTIFDLDANSESALSTTAPFRPNPRKIVSTYQKAQASLPRCLAVAVLLPWTNDGQYLFSQTNSSNPALIFNYANIVNDTPLGIIPGNGGLSASDKSSTVSQLTNMGHFYNPFAPEGSKQKYLDYWTVKLGGPQDQFLTRKSTDGSSSYYKNLDFVYLPYLPRWQDSGLFSATSGTGIDRISAAQLQSKFESVIKSNNFKVWIDASVTDSQLAQYGFGDLFVNSSDYRLKWLQPSLWNDSPETDLTAPYKSDDAEASSLSWSKKGQPVMTPGANDSGWNTSIIKGAKSFSFIKLSANQGATSFTKGATITGLVYGSLEGLRLNQPVTLALLNRYSLQPMGLLSRAQDQGRLYNVILTKIGPTTVSNGVESINITFTLSNNDYDTPLIDSGDRYALWSDLSMITVIAGPQFSTAKSTPNVTITADADGADVTVNTASNCTPTQGVLTACPAVGDLVDLTKNGSTPVWGKVTSVNYSGSGTVLDSIVLDHLHKSPEPLREMAYTYFTQGGNPRIAYYGGAVDMNDYDGGYASESSQLWIYDPESDLWQYITPGGSPPGPRAGASMVYDPVNNRLVMIGGYYHEAIDYKPGTINCELSQITCLYTNRPGMRVAKRVTNDVYAYNIGSNSWENIVYSFGGGSKIQTGVSYTARLTSTLADRSGLEGWNLVVKNPSTLPQTLKVDGTPSTITAYPTVAGLAKGDSVYIHGDRTSGGTFYSWGKINSIDYTAGTLNLTTYGYTPSGGETQVAMNTVAIQVLSRTNVTNSCVGGVDIGNFYFCQFNSNDSTGYAVGDSVVLEQYGPGDAQLVSNLSGFISYIDAAGKAYFVADERNPAIQDFSDRTLGKVANDSAVAFPSARYGATFASLPTAASSATYWEGAAKNVSYYHRFADSWKVQFAPGVGSASAAWSLPATTNDTSALSGGSYHFQVVRPDYSYQISTTTNTTNNPAITKSGDWDNGKHWLLEVNGADAAKVVTNSWATLERHLADGTREIFHGIVDNMYINQPSECGSYADTKLCLRHNPMFPNDSGLANNAANTKVSMNPSFSTDTETGGSFHFDGANGFVSLKNIPDSAYGAVPAIGATVMIWRDSGSWPLDAYTLTVNGRSYNNGSKTLSFYYDKMIASPHPFTYSTSQISSAGGVDRLVTATDHQMTYYDGEGAPEWTKDAAGGGWKLRLATKYSNYLYRPAPRRAGAVASIYDVGSQTSKIFLTGGTFGQFGTLWRQQNAGSTTSSAAWDPRLGSVGAANDLPNTFGGSLVVYKQGAGPVKAVAFGGKQKTDFSSADYGTSVGPYLLGRPDLASYSNVSDNSFYLPENSLSSGTDAASFVNTIENNLPANRPSVDKSLSFRAGSLNGSETVCAYLAQIGCSSKELLSQLGNLGRLDSSKTTYNGWSFGKSALINELGDAFKKQTVGGKTVPSLILGAPTLSGTGVNGRPQQDGYRPYTCDNGGALCANLPYGKLGSDFGSDKTAALAVYASINDATDKGGAILVTATAVGAAISGARGGSNGTQAGWYSYCAASEINKNADGSPVLQNDGTYSCKDGAASYLPWLPDAEDLLFALNAATAISAADTYKIVGYYGGVKRGYLVTSKTGDQPTVYEIVP